MKNSLLLILFCLPLASCALGPLTLNETGRTAGRGGNEMTGGYGNAGHSLKWNHGFTDDLDLGVQVETFSYGGRIKYALLQPDKETSHGLALAVAGGAGFSFGGRHYYGDFIGSYLFRWFEPYSGVRMVHVHTDATDINSGSINLQIPAYDYNYGQAFLGSRFWLSRTAYLTLEFSDLFAVTSGVKFGEYFLINAGIGLAL